ncbi:ABC transporter ATP-binding protein [Hyphomicrobium sp. CS1GBMeth3]|uniref:ABC transporter ATP-binding protein n=1 Tax=Hyphomicrobium sp. CS1GBMeth3 TaxID=1892845 RepID=UPI0009F9EDDE|nr:ABC transporter ATP-binding protein [Hyphomicrobium sp. CS1GBMeth3]
MSGAAVQTSSLATVTGTGQIPTGRTPAPQSGFAPWKDPSKRPIVRFENVVKRFGDFVAVKDCTLDIYEREFFALLGPSGCGKTTLLRMLAGFEKPTSGRILVGGEDITELAPYERPVNMMFQSYALFPHMTVEQNIGFGLKQEGMPKDQIATRVEEAMTMLELSGFGKRKPHQLSGGQQQRVALARAIAKKPRIVLLDEPLGALDKRLRQTAQFELMGIQERTGTTFIIVTHDQEEAMTVSSRIAVMDHGEFVQIATPGDIYEAPNSRYVANFIGDVNLLQGKVVSVSGGFAELDWGPGLARFKAIAPEGCVGDQTVWLTLRPEKIHISLEKPSDASNAVPGKVVDVGYLGSISHYHVELENGQRVKALRTNSSRLVDHPISWEDKVWLEWPPETGIVVTR